MLPVLMTTTFTSSFLLSLTCKSRLRGSPGPGAQSPLRGAPQSHERRSRGGAWPGAWIPVLPGYEDAIPPLALVRPEPAKLPQGSRALPDSSDSLLTPEKQV